MQGTGTEPIVFIQVLPSGVCREIKSNLKNDVARLKRNYQGVCPKLAIVQVGGREDSNVYIRMKMQAAAAVGAEAEHIKLPNTATQDHVSGNKIIHNIQGCSLLRKSKNWLDKKVSAGTKSKFLFSHEL